MNESGSAVRALAKRFGITEPALHRDRARRARPPAGDGAAEGGRRSGRAQRAALGAVAPPLVGLPPRAHRGGQAPRARPRARRTSCAGRPRRSASSSPPRCRRRRTRSSTSRPTAWTPPCVVPFAADLSDDAPHHSRPAAIPTQRRQPGRRPPPAAHATRRSARCSARPTPPSPSPRPPRRWSPPRWPRSPSARPCSWSPPRAWTPSGWATTWAASSRPRATREPGSPSSARWRGRSRVLPAWETLPFERVSPETETMGRRLAVLHALTGAPDPALPGAAPGDRGAGPGHPAAAGPARGDGARSSSGPGQQVDVADAAARAGGQGLPARAPGGAPWRVRRARRHRRRVPLDGGRAGPHRPVGRRGRPPHRVLRQRSALLHDIGAVALFGCRELVATPRSGPRRSRSWRGDHGGRRCGNAWPRASSSTAWSRGCPSSSAPSGCCRTSSRAGGQVVLAEPRRIRDRGTQLLDEEAALAETLAATWGAKEAEEEHASRAST